MALIVADSDVLIDALRGAEPMAERVGGLLRVGALATTAINRFELLSGARSRRQQETVERLLRPLTLLALDSSAADLAAEIRLELERAGRGIGTADYLIAGICLRRGCSLLTRNHAHFGRVPGLELA